MPTGFTVDADDRVGARPFPKFFAPGVDRLPVGSQRVHRIVGSDGKAGCVGEHEMALVQ